MLQPHFLQSGMLTALFMLYLFTAMWPTSLDMSVAAPKSNEGSSGTPATLERPGQAAKVDAEHLLEMLPPRVVPPARRGEKLQKGRGTPVRRCHSPPHRPNLGCLDREQRPAWRGLWGTGSKDGSSCSLHRTVKARQAKAKLSLP